MGFLTRESKQGWVFGGLKIKPLLKKARTGGAKRRRKDRGSERLGASVISYKTTEIRLRISVRAWRFLGFLKHEKTYHTHWGFWGFCKTVARSVFGVLKLRKKLLKLEALYLIFSNSRDVSILALNCKLHVGFDFLKNQNPTPDHCCVFQSRPYEKA